jgi:hypothetical protein
MHSGALAISSVKRSDPVSWFTWARNAAASLRQLSRSPVAAKAE